LYAVITSAGADAAMLPWPAGAWPDSGSDAATIAAPANEARTRLDIANLLPET
jgi:hypothetical protein